MGLIRKGCIFCLVGPSAGGKTTFAVKLVETFRGSVCLSVSATTRPPRDEEEVKKGGYIFLSQEAFKERISRGDFFEWEEIHGNLYGTLKSTIEDTLSSGRDLLLDIDVRGALSFSRAFPESTVLVLIIPPSSKILMDRLRARSLVTEEEVKRRLTTARGEYKIFLQMIEQGGAVDYFVVNETIEETFSILSSIVLAERNRVSRFNAEGMAEICKISDL